MHAVLLHLDAALTVQSGLRQAVCEGGGRVLDYRDLGPALRLWSWPAALERLTRRLKAALPRSLGPALVFSGSGDFHHVTLPLVERALETSGRPDLTVIHFDNHPDWVKFGPGVHCGSWVSRVARLAGVRRVLTVGVCSSDIQRPAAKGADLGPVNDGQVEIYPYRMKRNAERIELCGRQWPAIEPMGLEAFATLLASRIETEAIYVTIDKDVLRLGEAATNWDQGQISLADLNRLVAKVTAGRHLIGADVVGDWSPAKFGGGPFIGLLKRGEVLLDRPWRMPPPRAVAANEAVNLKLLAHFQEWAS